MQLPIHTLNGFLAQTIFVNKLDYNNILLPIVFLKHKGVSEDASIFHKHFPKREYMYFVIYL